ncbi:hypothetical protein Nans01_28020 [Nocardiopsis ansamitocini]|uniref:Uncharacterized protein n=1 Tax=Nocardiopsis ansamitocini TaxID=1670832 RepID=A0A9W6UH46_9ACTN|nr:hypothetical protein Nans01_28020 [Nocardiopsis ansamitocini]
MVHPAGDARIAQDRDECFLVGWGVGPQEQVFGVHGGGTGGEDSDWGIGVRLEEGRRRRSAQIR